MLWLKATFRLIELIPSHPDVSGIFRAKHSGLPAGLPVSQLSGASTQPATELQSSTLVAAPGVVGGRDAALYPSSPAQAWKYALLGCAGMGLMAFLVIRCEDLHTCMLEIPWYAAPDMSSVFMRVSGVLLSCSHDHHGLFGSNSAGSSEGMDHPPDL